MGTIARHRLRRSREHPSAHSCRQRRSRRNDSGLELLSVERTPSKLGSARVPRFRARFDLPVSRVVYAARGSVSGVEFALRAVLSPTQTQPICDISRSCVMLNTLPTDVRRATTWSIALSVLIIAAGVLAIGTPLVAGVAVAAIVGGLLVFTGLLHVAFAWRSARPGLILWQILVGMLYAAIGFYFMASPVAGLASLTVLASVYLFI